MILWAYIFTYLHHIYIYIYIYIYYKNIYVYKKVIYNCTYFENCWTKNGVLLVLNICSANSWSLECMWLVVISWEHRAREPVTLIKIYFWYFLVVLWNALKRVSVLRWYISYYSYYYKFICTLYVIIYLSD